MPQRPLNPFNGAIFKENLMFTQPPKELSENIHIDCYCCGVQVATHLCRFRLGQLPVQVCLCQACMQLDTAEVFEKTLGISYPEDTTFVETANVMPV
jgi:hypothetical protein